MQITCSLITAKTPPILSKSFMLDGAGALIKKPGGQLVDGEATRLELTLQDFAELLSNTKPNQALVYGISEHPRAVIVPQAKLNGRRTDPPTIARDRAHFAWPSGAGVLMLDHDPLPGKAMTRDQLLRVLYDVWPQLESAPHIWTTSASSCIYSQDGVELRGIAGQRVYVPVQNAADIPRLGQALADRLWMAGHGRFIVSASGALLDRCLVDTAVWQPERLDFAGGAQCGPGLQQRRPAPMVFNAEAGPIDSRTLPDLPPDRIKELERLKQAARELLKDEVAAKRAAWVEARLAEALEKIPKQKRAETERLRDVYRRAVESKRLLGDFELHGRDGKITVAQILADPDKYHGARFCDPLEPGYGNDDRIAVVNLQVNPPYLFSHAHGGQKFTLHRALEQIELREGELHAIVAKTLEVMRKDGAIYDRCDQLVRLSGGRLYPVQAPYLAMHLTGLIRFTRWDKKTKASLPKDCPEKIPLSLLASAGAWDLPKLEGIVNAPFMDMGGRIIEQEGYDPATQIYLNFPQFDKWRPIPKHPNRRELQNAIDRLWHPFKDFPFVDSISKGVYLAALLTAVQRFALPTAPGILVTAPMAGSGKTILALCLGALMGSTPTVASRPTDETEMGKMLIATGRRGDQILVFDNLSGNFKSDELCKFMTSDHYTSRILGVSEMATTPTKTLIVCTGNNVQITGDLNRRFLRCEIDPECEYPAKRRFDLDPLAYVNENRLEMVNAALVILAAAREYVHHQPLSGLASFEPWNATIRRAVVMVQTLGLLDVADPVQSIDQNCDNDPDRAKLGMLLKAWSQVFGDESATVRLAIMRAGEAKNAVLHEAIFEIAGEAKGINSKKLGRWIQTRKGQIVDGMRFQSAGRDREKIGKWVVKCRK